MYSKLTQIGSALAIVAGMLSLGNPVAQGQTFRQEGRMQARASRQTGRAEARSFGNAGTGYYYAPGGYYTGYGPAYGAYYGTGSYGPGYYYRGAGVAGPGYYGGSRYYSGYASGPAYGGPVYGGGPAYAPEAYARPPYPRQRAYLGITMSETPDGVVRISGVRTNSPAAEAGLRVGDAILALDGREIYSAQDVSRMVARHVPGEAVALDIDRNGRNDRVEALLTGQTGQFVAGAPAQSGFVPDYVEPTFDQPGPMTPLQARRAANAAIDPNLYQAY